jgi:polygalacturonase
MISESIDPSVNKIFNIRNYGAIGDGCTLDMGAIQSALDACAAVGGGTVLAPPGRYLTGRLIFHSHITFQLKDGAVILGSIDPKDYPVDLFRWEGVEQASYAPIFSGQYLNDIAITGQGTIDGNGKVWWERFKNRTLTYPRPRMIGFSDCSNVLIEGLKLVNSPSWTVNPVRCENVTIHGLNIINPPDSPNTDGINPDSCKHVRISNCYVSVGDDCITLKSGTEHEKGHLREACHDISITNCTLANGHGGVVIGSEMSGNVFDVSISDCTFTGTDRGIRLKSRRRRGGIVEDIRVSNLTMEKVLCPITMNLYYHIGVRGDPFINDKNPRPKSTGTPRFRNIHFSHITAKDVKYAAGFIYGLAEMPVENISFDHMVISLAKESEQGYPEMADGLESMAQAGLYINNACNIHLECVEIQNQRGPAFMIHNANQVEIIACGAGRKPTEKPLIHLSNVQNCTVRACQPPLDKPDLILVSGDKNMNLVLPGSTLSAPQS